jgi:hypothetical protein
MACLRLPPWFHGYIVCRQIRGQFYCLAQVVCRAWGLFERGVAIGRALGAASFGAAPTSGDRHRHRPHTRHPGRTLSIFSATSLLISVTRRRSIRACGTPLNCGSGSERGAGGIELAPNRSAGYLSAETAVVTAATIAPGGSLVYPIPGSAGYLDDLCVSRSNARGPSDWKRYWHGHAATPLGLRPNSARGSRLPLFGIFGRRRQMMWYQALVPRYHLWPRPTATNPRCRSVCIGLAGRSGSSPTNEAN